LNKSALGIIDPRSEIKLDVIDNIEYPDKPETITVPQGHGESYSDDQRRVTNKMRSVKKTRVGEYLLFSQCFNGYQVAGSEILLSFDTLRVIRGLNYIFYPGVRDIDFDSFIDETEARLIAIEDTTIDWMIKDDPSFQDWMEFVNDSMPELSKYLGKSICMPVEKRLSCDSHDCILIYDFTICVNQDVYRIWIDGKTRKVRFGGIIL
jgi:hypothetical protein